MRKKMLYIMHVDWDWIKQRPHYIAENFSRYYDCLIAYPMSKKRTALVKNDKSIACGCKFKPFLRVPSPFRQKNPLLYGINKTILRYYFSYLIAKFDPEYIWITFPELYDYLPPSALKKTIIYDCMDDALAFEAYENINRKLLEVEKKLIDQASIIFTSSDSLAKKVNDRQPCQDKVIMARNAFGGTVVSEESLELNAEQSDTYKIGYIGTISSWFDLESLAFTLNLLDNIEYHIIGPIDIDIKPWQHNRIKFYGPKEHDDLYLYAKEFDCLIMPFKVNDLILSVDPVKLYEYVNLGKPIISIFYKEIERFLPYVAFYSTKEELVDILSHMIKTGFVRSYSDEQRHRFLSENSWGARVKDMASRLNKLHI